MGFPPPPPSGGTTYDQWVVYSGDPVNIADNASANLTWDTYGAGDSSLVTLGDLGKPLIVTAGIYTLTCKAIGQTLTADGFFELVAHIDADGDDAVGGTQSRLATVVASTPMAGTSVTFFCPAGGALRAEVINNDGASARNFFLQEALLQRLS